MYGDGLPCPGAPQVGQTAANSGDWWGGQLDGSFGLKRLCLGACALGPVVVIDGEYCGHSSPLKMEKF